MGTFVGHSFLNRAHSLDAYNITFIANSHVCDQRNNFCFLKGIQQMPYLFPFGSVIWVNTGSQKAKHLFMCLFDTPISSSVKCLCLSFGYFLIGFFLLWSFGNSLYILDMNPVSDMWLMNILLRSVTCLFILLTDSTEKKVFWVFFFCFFFSSHATRLATRYQTWATAVKVLSPNHWTAREFPKVFNFDEVQLIDFFLLWIVCALVSQSFCLFSYLIMQSKTSSTLWNRCDGSGPPSQFLILSYWLSDLSPSLTFSYKDKGPCLSVKMCLAAGKSVLD